MLWFSAAVLFLLTAYAWRNAQKLKREGDPAGLRSAYVVAVVLGTIGTVCTLAAALI